MFIPSGSIDPLFYWISLTIFMDIDSVKNKSLTEMVSRCGTGTGSEANRNRCEWVFSQCCQN